MIVHMLHVHSDIHLYVVHVHVCVDIQSRNRGLVILMQFSTHCISSGGTIGVLTSDEVIVSKLSP